MNSWQEANNNQMLQPTINNNERQPLDNVCCAKHDLNTGAH